MRISQFLIINVYTYIYLCNIKVIYHLLGYCGSFGNKELDRALQASIGKEHNPGMSGFTRNMAARVSYL